MPASSIPRSEGSEHGKPNARYLGTVVYSDLDGIITTFAVASGVAGAALGAEIVQIQGLANLLADGFSITVGADLSFRSQHEYYERERQRQSWPIVHQPSEERAILGLIYRQAGYTDTDIEQLLGVLVRYPKRWNQTMLIEELGLLADDRSLLTIAWVTFAAFVAAGAVPLLSYLADLVVPIAPGVAFVLSLLLSGLAIFGLALPKFWLLSAAPCAAACTCCWLAAARL